MQVKCKFCKKQIQVSPYKVANRPNGIFCSRSCFGKSRTGSKNSNWKGGRLNYQGRSFIYAPEHSESRCFGGAYILEYRLIAEKKIGRKLRRNEIVHHLNGNTNDNRPENLEVLTQSEHARKHLQEEGRRCKKTGRILSAKEKLK